MREQHSYARVTVVGPGTRFLSGVTCYTFALCNALAETCDVSAILMRQLLPTRLYPGRARVGAALTDLSLAPTVRGYDGVDWFWGVTLLRALLFLARRRPHVLLLQWWTGTVLHTYLVLAVVARLLGCRVVIEFHEALDPAEDHLPLVQRYVGVVAPWLFRLAAGYIVHSEHDRCLVAQRYGTDRAPVEVISFATWDHYRCDARLRAAPADCCNLLFFGLIRPYKGLDVLIDAFNSIPPEEIDRYVSDAEVGGYVGGADAVVLPYRRSCGSGALHVALHHGLPVVVTPVGALVEAISGYEGAVVADALTPMALLAALRRAAALRGQRFADPRPWSDVPPHYHAFFARLDAACTGRGPVRDQADTATLAQSSCETPIALRRARP